MELWCDATLPLPKTMTTPAPSNSVASARKPDLEEAAKSAKLDRKGVQDLVWLFRYIRPHRGIFILSCLMLVVTSSMGTAFPYLSKCLIDSSSHEEAAHWAILTFCVLMTQAILTFIQSIIFNYVGERGLANLRRDLFAHLTEMPSSFYSKNSVGELLSRISADVTQLNDAFVFAVPQFLRQSIIFTGSLALIFWMSPQLTIVMISCFPPTIIVAIWLGRMVGKNSRQSQDELAKATGVVEEALQNIATVKAYAAEFLEQKRYSDRLDGFVSAVMRTARIRGGLIAFIIFGIFSAIVVVLWYGTTLLLDHKLEKGQMLGFFLYTAFIGGALGSFADLYSNLRKSLGATQHVLDLMREPTEVLDDRPPGSKAPPVKQLRGEIRFEEVVFSYPSRADVQVLKGLDFEVPSGKIVALVGPSGAGKSTVVSLLLRFYEPSSGRLKFDGYPATEFTLHEIRQQMALVPQEVLLFGGSIGENIGYGRPGASQPEIEQAAKLAHAHEFITKFPDGYGTLVGDRGVQLSGGQRQRVAIARALLKNPKILILDEATSALDAESEQLVQMALETLMEGRTCLIIAHRLSTIRKADRIVMLRDGKVIESGSHEELMMISEGAYRRVVELQTSLD